MLSHADRKLTGLLCARAEQLSMIQWGLTAAFQPNRLRDLVTFSTLGLTDPCLTEVMKNAAALCLFATARRELTVGNAVGH